MIPNTWCQVRYEIRAVKLACSEGLGRVPHCLYLCVLHARSNPHRSVSLRVVAELMKTLLAII